MQCGCMSNVVMIVKEKLSFMYDMYFQVYISLRPHAIGASTKDFFIFLLLRYNLKYKFFRRP